MMKGLLPAALTLLTVTSGLGDQAMNPKVNDKDAFAVIGPSARTSNRREVTADGVIGPAWARFFQESLLTKIPYRADPTWSPSMPITPAVTTASIPMCWAPASPPMPRSLPAWW